MMRGVARAMIPKQNAPTEVSGLLMRYRCAHPSHRANKIGAYFHSIRQKAPDASPASGVFLSAQHVMSQGKYVVLERAAYPSTLFRINRSTPTTHNRVTVFRIMPLIVRRRWPSLDGSPFFRELRGPRRSSGARWLCILFVRYRDPRRLRFRS